MLGKYIPHNTIHQLLYRQIIISLYFFKAYSLSSTSRLSHSFTTTNRKAKLVSCFADLKSHQISKPQSIRMDFKDPCTLHYGGCGLLLFWGGNNGCIVDLLYDLSMVRAEWSLLIDLCWPYVQMNTGFSILTAQPDTPSHTSPWTIWRESPPFSHPWSSPSRPLVWCPAPSPGSHQGSFQTWSQNLETQTTAKPLKPRVCCAPSQPCTSFCW